MEELAQLLANRRIPGEHPHRRMSARQDDSHVKEPTIAEVSFMKYLLLSYLFCSCEIS